MNKFNFFFDFFLVVLNLKFFLKFLRKIYRSISAWSANVPEAERSIYKAYLSTIKNAKHCIYIENQYFISSIDREVPKNKVLKALYQR